MDLPVAISNGHVHAKPGNDVQLAVTAKYLCCAAEIRCCRCIDWCPAPRSFYYQKSLGSAYFPEIQKSSIKIVGCIEVDEVISPLSHLYVYTSHPLSLPSTCDMTVPSLLLPSI